MVGVVQGVGWGSCGVVVGGEGRGERDGNWESSVRHCVNKGIELLNITR